MSAPLHVFTNGCDWVVATDAEDAWAVWCGSNGERRSDFDDDFEFELEPDDKPLTIWNEDAGFDQCDCRAKLEEHKRDVAKKVQVIEAQPPVARAKLWAAVPKMPATNPSGHLVGCAVGSEQKSCAEWVAQGRGFLCSTEY